MKNNNNQDVTELILSSEDYVAVAPHEKQTVEFQLAMIIKQKIRDHKWCAGTEGRNLSWEEARDEWKKLYYKDFLKYIEKHLKPKKKTKKRIAEKLNYSFERRPPMISGGSL